jgi:hypothetical protein
MNAEGRWRLGTRTVGTHRNLAEPARMPNDDRGPAGGTLTGTRPGSATSSRLQGSVSRKTRPVDSPGDGGHAVQGVPMLQSAPPRAADSALSWASLGARSGALGLRAQKNH